MKLHKMRRCSKKRLATGALGLLAALACGLISPPAAMAGEPASDSPKVELVLDVSGTMRARDVDGDTRMAAAKQAFNEVLDATPEEVRLGIRTLGAELPRKGPRGRLPGQREQLYPVGQVDRTEAKAAVATLRPTGWTPIGLALRGASKDLSSGDEPARIVLITDGEDSCGQPDPCDVARELAAQGTHLVVDTLGLTLDRKVREQLSCIAEATGGTYTAIQHRDQLSSRIKQLVRRSASARADAHAGAGRHTVREGPVPGLRPLQRPGELRRTPLSTGCAWRPVRSCGPRRAWPWTALSTRTTACCCGR
ncbi:hypothetical protein SANTM175S_06385 [Streptomyces antimycoticus]